MFKALVLSIFLLEVVNLSDISYYEILGVTKQATSQEIRQAYKKLAVKLHPDKHSDTSKQDKFIKITEAYETLKDPEKRQKYDLYGSYPSYTRRYDHQSQNEYNNLFYNGLYHDDPFVDTLSGKMFQSYMQDGFYFINFYSPFCPPCQNLVDHWKKLAELYKGIVKVGAVNCKYHNSFCYNTMRIGSYPSLLFYTNGKSGNYMYYRGERTLEHLDQFILKQLNARVQVPVVSQIRSTSKPTAYVLGANRFERSTLIRIAYQVNSLVDIAIVENENLRAKLTDNDYITVVYKYKDIVKEIESTDEKEVLKEIVETLPKIKHIDPDRLKDIRKGLRSGSKNPWMLYFATKGDDRLLLYQTMSAFPDMHFGEIDCEKWVELCASLHALDTPSWGVLKVGGGYQHTRTSDIRAFIETAVPATNLHTLSASDLTRIIDGDVGMWVLLVVPHQLSWDHMAEPFTQTSLHFLNSNDISFGIMACTMSTDKHCRRLANNQPSIVVQEGQRRHHYSGSADKQQLVEFIHLLLDSNDLELSEEKVLEILGASNRDHSWLLAFLPANCQRCPQLAHEWRLVANKLRPLEDVKVGMLWCQEASRFCANVRSPTARLYPPRQQTHYTISLQQMSEAPYILEWAIDLLHDAVTKLNWDTFSRKVIADELNPSRMKKPWLVYFHSPRCYRCYEMYSDFAIAGILLNEAVELGKVNCLENRSLCQQQQVTSYPSIRLYLPRSLRSVLPLQPKEYAGLLQDIRPHIAKYQDNVLDFDDIGLRSQGFHAKHDEF